MTDGLPLTWDATNVRAVTSDDAVVKYESLALPSEPVNKFYGITESKTVSNMKLKKFALTYFELSSGTYVPKSNVVSTSITIDSNTDLNIVTISSDFTSVNGSITTTKDSLLTGTVNLKRFYIGETANCKYYDVGSGDGSGTIIDINDNSSSSCAFNILQTCEDDLYCSSRLKYIPSTNTLCVSNIDGNRIYKCVYLCAGCYDKVGLCLNEYYNNFALNSWIDEYSTGCKKPFGIRTTCTSASNNYRQLEIGQWDTGVAGNFGLCHGIAITSNTVNLCSITNTSIDGFGYRAFFGNRIICSNIPSPTYGCCPTVHAITTDCQVGVETVEPGRLMVCCGTAGWKKYLIEGEVNPNEIKADKLCDNICYCSSAKAQDDAAVVMHAYRCGIDSNNPRESYATLGYDGFYLTCVPFYQQEGSQSGASTCAVIGNGCNFFNSENGLGGRAFSDVLSWPLCICEGLTCCCNGCFCSGLSRIECVCQSCGCAIRCLSATQREYSGPNYYSNCSYICQYGPYIKSFAQCQVSEGCYCSCLMVTGTSIEGSVCDNPHNVSGCFALEPNGRFRVCNSDTNGCWARVLTECDSGNTCILKNPSWPNYCLHYDGADALNLYGNTNNLWLNYAGGVSIVRIGNGAGTGCLGNLYAAVICSNCWCSQDGCVGIYQNPDPNLRCELCVCADYVCFNNSNLVFYTAYGDELCASNYVETEDLCVCGTIYTKYICFYS